MPAAPRDTRSSARTSRVGREAVVEHARARVAGHRRHARVVGVEHGPAARGQGLDELPLAGLDGLDGAGAREMHAPHRGHDADGRPREVGQQRDLTGRVEAHLEHGHLVLGAQAQQRQRQPDLVVLVAGAAQHREALRQHLGRELLGGGLGQRAGDADDERVEAIAVARGGRLAGRPRCRPPR